MRARSGIGSLVLLAMSFGCCSLRAAPIAPGNGQQTADLNGTKLVVYTYRPRCSNPNVLFVFHGLNRTPTAIEIMRARLATASVLWSWRRNSTRIASPPGSTSGAGSSTHGVVSSRPRNGPGSSWSNSATGSGGRKAGVSHTR